MAIMTATARLAGTPVTVCADRIVAHGRDARIGLGGVEWQTFGYNALAHTLVGIGGFLLSAAGGCSAPTRGEPQRRAGTSSRAFRAATLAHGRRDRCADRSRWRARADVGMVTLACAAVLIPAAPADETRAIQRMPGA